MFAVIRTGGKQYRVAADDLILVEKLAGEPGSTIEIKDVLMIGGGGKASDLGTPVLEKAAVFAEVVEQTRGDKIIILKKHRRKRYRRKAGHRQDLTRLRITEISATGKQSQAKPKAKPATKAKAKPKAKPKPAAKAEAAPEAKPEAKPKAKAKSKE